MTPEFAEKVEAKIAASEDVGGWAKGPAAIIAEAADETIDIPAWLRGLDGYEKPDGAEELIATIASDAALLWEALARLRVMYE